MFDVIVLGAGPAGSVTALRLAREGLRVALVDRSRFEVPRIGESLPPVIQPLLSELSLWTEFQAIAPIPSFGTRSLWGSATPEAHSHIVTPYGFGWHIDRLRFDRMLVDAAVRSGADLRLDTRVARCEQDGDCWLMHMADGAELQARFVIDATGRSAWFSRRRGCESVAFDSLVGVAAQVSCPAAGTGDSCFTQVETTRHGWWYTAPIADDRFIAVLLTDADLVKPNALHTRAGWVEALRCAPATMERLSLGLLPDTGDPQPQIHSAVSQRMMRTQMNDRWLGVGDAALAVDPVSGSGISRALRTARDAAETVMNVLFSAEVPGGAISGYEQRRNVECTGYLEERAMYYGAEQRWREHPFWKRRSGMGTVMLNSVIEEGAISSDMA